MTRGRRTPDDIKAAVVATYIEHGLAETHRRTGHPKATIRMWAAAAGSLQTVRTSEINRRAAEDGASRRRRLIAEADERAITLLTVVRDLALQHTVKLIQEKPDDIRAVVGAWTRATHDIALLQGKATERNEGAVVVEVRHSIDDLIEKARKLQAIDVPSLPRPEPNGHTNGHGPTEGVGE